MEEYFIAVFATAHLAIHSEKIIKTKFPSAKLIPLPSEISSGCGLCLKIMPESLDGVILEFKENNISFDGLYKIIKKGYSKILEPIQILL
ncbi:MAG: DUF3343 domain-containing protein [Clostridiales bacterium]|jgi:hypothetical protein|nr:DUF3343 domain-containing protein [Clostridiales bacterium]